MLLDAMRAGRECFGFRLVHYAVLANHLHLVVEAGDSRSLSRGMQGLAVRMARALNRAWRRRGKVFAERFHAHVLKTPREVRNALRYVLENARRHGAWLRRGGVDPFSSARAPLGRARTWLLSVGLRMHGRPRPSHVC